MWEPHSSTVVGHDVWDLLLADALSNNLAELEASLLIVNLVWLESSLDVVENSEILVSFFNSNNVHLAKRESGVSSDLSVDLDESLLVLDDLLSLVSGESVLESLLEENGEWDALSKLVWTSRWLGSVHSLEFSEVPLLWSGDSLDNFSLSLIALKQRRLNQARIDKTRSRSVRFLTILSKK